MNYELRHRGSEPVDVCLAGTGGFGRSSLLQSFAIPLLSVRLVIIFDIIGFFMRRFGFSVAPVAIGLILVHMVETNLQNSLKIFDGQWWLIFTQPLALLFIVLSIFSLFGPAVLARFKRRPT